MYESYYSKLSKFNPVKIDRVHHQHKSGSRTATAFFKNFFKSS